MSSHVICTWENGWNSHVILTWELTWKLTWESRDSHVRAHVETHMRITWELTWEFLIEQPAVFFSLSRLQRASASDAALSLSRSRAERRLRRTPQIYPATTLRFRASIKDLLFKIKVCPDFLYYIPAPTGYRPSHAVSFGGRHTDEDWWVPEFCEANLKTRPCWVFNSMARAFSGVRY